MSSIPLDISIFQSIHSLTSCSGTGFDKFNLFITSHSQHIWFSILLIFTLIGGKSKYYPMLICLSGFVLAWYMSDEYLKPTFALPRPFNIIENTCVYGMKPSSSSFPSGHTITSFAMATLIFLFNRKHYLLTALSIIFAFYVGFTRIYLGVHFPTDILGGAIMGSLMGIGWFYSTEYARKNYT